MTYKELTKQIEDVDAQIRFMKDVYDSHYSNDKSSSAMIGNIINNLVSWKNHLRFDRDYVDRGYYEIEQENSMKYLRELEEARKTIIDLEERLKTTV